MITKKQLRRDLQDVTDHIINEKSQLEKKIKELEKKLGEQYLYLKHLVIECDGGERTREEVIDLLKEYYPDAVLRIPESVYPGGWYVNTLGNDVAYDWTLMVEGKVWEKEKPKK